uniref:EpsG family protein n=1 Tax=Flavobacterium sp. TaxID=239 RepID=UPI0025DC30AA
FTIFSFTVLMKNAFFYFIMFPFLGFINAIKNYRSSWAKPTIIAFVAFFGLSMVKSDTVDSARYIQNLEVMYDSNKDYETIQNSLYTQEGGQVDIYVILVTFIFSIFTDNGNILFLFFGLVFGYFYANNIWSVLNQSKGKLSWEQYLLIACFSLVVGFWTVNGVRMWTAAHVFFYGGFLYLFHNKKKGLLIAATSILFHFSFVIPVVLLIAYSLVRLNFRFLYIFYIASFFIAELNVDFIRNMLETNLPDFLLPKVKTYFNEDYIEGYEKIGVAANWYILYYKKILTYFTVIFISILFFKGNLTSKTRNLLGFSLLFLAIANILSLLPSGGRFLNVAFLFSLATSFIVVTNSKESIIGKSARLFSPLLVLFCIISIRLSFDYFNVTTLTNPIVVFLTNVNQPLIDLFK